ncbi:MAG: DUF4936 family protein, partial [Casimicrobiaceae bacterium]
SAAGPPQSARRLGGRRRVAPRRGDHTDAAASGGAVHYYVYYRVLSTQVAAARAVIARLFAHLEERTGVSGRLLQRQDEPLLWMEIYEGVRDAREFERILAELLAETDFAVYLVPGAERHTERFVAAAP